MAATGAHENAAVTSVTARRAEISDGARMHLATIARGQAGAFAIDQALACGWTQARLHRALGRGDIRRLLPRVYAFTAAPPSRLQRAHAALLWGGRDSALCKLTAAEFHGLSVDAVGPIQIIVPRRRRAPHHQLKVYRRDELLPAHTRRRGGLAVTTVPRTLLDLAWDLRGVQFEALVDESLVTHKTTHEELGALWASYHASGRNGCVRYRASLNRRSPGESPPTNLNERRLFDLLEAGGLPRPVCQFCIYDGDNFVARPDFAYVEERLALQAQSRRWHEGHARRLADDRQSNALMALGWRAMRFWWEDVEEQPENVIALVRSALSCA